MTALLSEQKVETISKLQNFETSIFESIKSCIFSSDPNSCIKIAGSYKNNADRIRLTSDIDVIIFSEVLSNPNEYVALLKDINQRALLPTEQQSFYFTKVNSEIYFIHEAKKSTGLPFNKLVPVHFLVYNDMKEFFTLEPQPLASRLIEKEDPFNGSKETTWATGVRWDIERALTEYVLNQGILSRDFLAAVFVSNVLESVRRLSDTFGTNVPGILKTIEPSLPDIFAPMFHIHSNLESFLLYSTDDVMAGPIKFLENIPRKEKCN